MPLRAALLLIFLAASAAPASPQGSDFSALRDSLAGQRDITELRRLEAARKPGRNGPADAFVAQGLIALRLYDLTQDRVDNQRARQAFEAALQKEPSLGWAQYGLGVTLASSPEAKPVNQGGKPGLFAVDDVARRLLKLDARSRARRAFSAALRSQPPVPRAARELADLA